MRTISALKFKQLVEQDPAWASKLTERVEIDGYCNMNQTGITHLSPLLRFTGRDGEGTSASFWACEDLKTAEGMFDGNVVFTGSGIEKIGKLTINQPDDSGKAADFQCCENLKVAEGTFPGTVHFNQSGIEKIGELTITKPNKFGRAADFSKCPNLKTARGNFPGAVNFKESGIVRIGELTIQPNKTETLVNLCKCEKLKPSETVKAWLETPGVVIDDPLREQLLHKIQCQAKVKAAAQKQPEIEI